MQDIWGRRTETGHTGEEFREEVQLHLTRNLGEPHVAFSDQDGWAGKSKEPGPPVDVMVIPPEGERRFAVLRLRNRTILVRQHLLENNEIGQRIVDDKDS